MYDFSWGGMVSDGVLRKGFEFGEDVEAIALREIDVDIGETRPRLWVELMRPRVSVHHS
jgi:hypothetical protein